MFFLGKKWLAQWVGGGICVPKSFLRLGLVACGLLEEVSLAFLSRQKPTFDLIWLKLICDPPDHSLTHLFSVIIMKFIYKVIEAHLCFDLLN